MAKFSTTLFDHQWIQASRGVPRSKQKLLVVLHGRGDSRLAFEDIKQEMRLPHFNYLLINAPRKYLSGFSWCALQPRSGSSIDSVRERLFDLVDELKTAGFRTSDIFWLGHSQGCLIASDLVMNHPASFGGVVGVSGYLWFYRGWKKQLQHSGARKTPWLLTHGSRDRLIPLKEINRDVSALSRGEVSVEFKKFPKGHDFDYSGEFPFIRNWIRDGSLKGPLQIRQTRRA
jgi:phospholipase/carboxylesterase